VLYIESGEVCSALELMRRVCDPSSRSMPHVTVRYSTQKMRRDDLQEYSETVVDHLILVGPASFDSLGGESGGLRTLIIRCESDKLEALSDKPDFPDTVFHITIYDGAESKLASDALAMMREFRWNLKLSLHNGRLENPVDRKVTPMLGPNDRIRLSEDARRLLARIGGRKVSGADLIELSDTERLVLLRELCEVIDRSGEVERVARPPAKLQRLSHAAIEGQGYFWSEDEISALHPIGGQSVLGKHLRPTGSFLTTPRLARDIVRAVLAFHEPGDPIHFGDPAIGSGIFYARLLEQAGNYTIASGLGVEMDEWRARRTAERWSRTGLSVRLGDFLSEPVPDQMWNLVIANPPYVRSQGLDARSMTPRREELEKRHGIRIGGRADLYVYFILTAHFWMEESAVAAWLLPSEFLSANYSSSLREYLIGKVQLLRVHSYGSDSSEFANARVSSTVVIFRKAKPMTGAEVEFSSGGTLDAPVERLQVSASRLDPAAKWSWPNLRPPAHIPSTEPTLGELFQVQRGIATGANAYFVLSDEQLGDLDVNRRWVTPILPRARLLTSDVVECDEFRNPLVEGRRWLIDTNEPIEEIRSRSPRFAAYLDKVFLEVGLRRLVRGRSPFYRQERREAPLFVFVYMAKGGAGASPRRFYLNHSRAVVLNNYLGLRPRPVFSDWLNAATGRDMRVLEGLITISPEELDRCGRQYVSGLLKLEPGDLKSVRLSASVFCEIAQELRQ